MAMKTNHPPQIRGKPSVNAVSSANDESAHVCYGVIFISFHQLDQGREAVSNLAVSKTICPVGNHLSKKDPALSVT